MASLKEILRDGSLISEGERRAKQRADADFNRRLSLPIAWVRAEIEKTKRVIEKTKRDPRWKSAERKAQRIADLTEKLNDFRWTVLLHRWVSGAPDLLRLLDDGRVRTIGPA
jgi:hypothetical protein